MSAGYVRRARGYAIEARAKTMELVVAKHRARGWPNGRPRRRPWAIGKCPREVLWSLESAPESAWRRSAYWALRWLLS